MIQINNFYFSQQKELKHFLPYQCAVKPHIKKNAFDTEITYTFFFYKKTHNKKC